LSAPLEWRSARRDDRGLLQSFTCASDRPRNWREPHPRLWELEVQSWVRELKPPIHQNRALHRRHGKHAVDVAASMAAPDRDHTIVSGNIDRRNRASQRCFAFVGFTRDVTLVDPTFEQWLLRVDFEE